MVFFFFMQFTYFRGPGSTLASDGWTARLRVLLVKDVGLDFTETPPRTALVKPQEGLRHVGVQRNAGLPQVLPDKEPELASDISLEIDDFRAAGFMILAMEIDHFGVPASVEIIYSELPSEVTDLLVKRFSEAKFSPAMKAGRVTAAPILIRIDIE